MRKIEHANGIQCALEFVCVPLSFGYAIRLVNHSELRTAAIVLASVDGIEFEFDAHQQWSHSSANNCVLKAVELQPNSRFDLERMAV